VNIISSNLTSVGYSAFSYCKNLISIIIPSSVTSIGEYAFYGCENLETVIYHGSNDPKNRSSIFGRELKFVCVPSSYNNNSFCGLTRFCKHESCESFLYNQCFEPVCIDDGTITMKKRENATEWESKSNGCYEYQCDNESGPIYWKECNSSEGTERVCENDRCIKIESEKEKKLFHVEIELTGLDLTNFNGTEFQVSLSNLANIEAEKLRIRVNMNEKDEVIHIIVVVNDKTTADIISDKINELECNNSSNDSSESSDSRDSYGSDYNGFFF